MNTYAIIDESSGFLVNIVIWDGSIKTWQPPSGTQAVPLSDIDLQSLPPPPVEE
jgi:hypothetical protein